MFKTRFSRIYKEPKILVCAYDYIGISEKKCVRNLKHNILYELNREYNQLNYV